MKSKTNRIASERKLQEGLEKQLGKSATVVLKGDKHKVSEILAILQERLDASEPVEKVKLAWITAAQKERRVLEGSNELVADLIQYIKAVHGASPEALAEFGIVPKPRRLTAQERLETVQKAEATRVARGTMGRRQREKVKGVVTNDAPSPADATPKPA